MAKFSQPAFRKAKNDKTTPANDNTPQHSQPPRHHQTGSRLLDLHQQRVQTAGRVGTKRFVNPCLVFIGNLPYNTTSEELQSWLCDQMATPAPLLLHQNVDIIRDWKTGQSKGYAFVTFAAAHLATLAIDRLHHCQYQGRLLTVSQGRKKPDPNLILLQEQKKQRKLQRSLEQEATETALEILEPEEYALLARLDPDLLVNTEVEDDSLEDNDDDYDGDFIEYEEDGPEEDEAGRMNRQQRREAAKGKKKRKLPHKGFG
jgi:RNA recognition motif-containing protein